MSTSVCLSVSVCPRAYLPNHTRYRYQIFVHVAYGRGSVLPGGVTKS